MFVPLKRASVCVVAVLIGLAMFSFTQVAYSHSMDNPFIAYTRTYFMSPGDTVSHDMRICARFPTELAVHNVTFTGNNSNWAKVDKGQFPLTASPAANGTASVAFPVTVTVPANFTGDHGLVKTVIGIQAGGISLPLQTDLRIIITGSNVAPQNPPACTSLIETQRTLITTSIILGSSGAGLGALGYFAYRQSKAKSERNRASIASKVLLMLLATIAFFLILGAFLFLPR